MGYDMPNISNEHQSSIKIEDLVSSPRQTETSPQESSRVLPNERHNSQQSEELEESLIKDTSGHEHYIGPSGTLNFLGKLRKLVDTNDTGGATSPGGSTNFTRDTTAQALEAIDDDAREVELNAPSAETPNTSPQDGPSPATITSTIACDFTRFPTGDMDEILRQFPPNVSLEALINSYFRHAHNDFPLFHRATFEDEYELYIVQARRKPTFPHDRRQSPVPEWGWIGCLHMIIVFGSIADRNIPYVDHPALRRNSVSAAKALLPQFISKCSLSNVRVLMLLALFLHNNNERNAAWNLVGIAIRISFALGLHRSDLSSSFRPLEREVRKWVFCTIYTFEQFLASSLGRPSSLQDADVNIVAPREGFVDGCIGPDARIVSWSLRLQDLLSKTRLSHLGKRRPNSPPDVQEILDSLDTWKKDITQAPGFDVPWVKDTAAGLTPAQRTNSMTLENLKVSLAWKTRSQLRAVLLLHIQFHYIAIVATRPVLLRDVAVMRKPAGTASLQENSVSPHATICVQHACQLASLFILLDYFDVVNGLSGLDVFYAYCAAMILILRLLGMPRGSQQAAEPLRDVVSLYDYLRSLVSSIRDIINRTDKSGSMRRFARVVDTFSECINNPRDQIPNFTSLPAQGFQGGTTVNSGNLGSGGQSQMGFYQPMVPYGGSMEGFLDLLPTTGFGMGDGQTMMPFIGSGDLPTPQWSDMEMMLAGYGEPVSSRHTPY